MRIGTRLEVILTAVLISSPLVAQIPLPDAIVYGTVPGAGPIVGFVERDGAALFEVPAELTTEGDVSYYVLRLAMEADVGGPASGAIAARDGDLLVSITLDGVGQTSSTLPLTLAFAETTRIDLGDGGPGPSDGFLRGDCDLSLLVDFTDAIWVLEFLLLGTKTPDCDKACDFDGTGELDLSDAINSLTFLFLANSRPPPAPHPSCGVEESPTALSCETPSCLFESEGTPKSKAMRLTSRKGASDASTGLQGPPIALTDTRSPRMPTDDFRRSRALNEAPEPDSDFGTFTEDLIVTPKVVSFEAISRGVFERPVSIRNVTKEDVHLSLSSSHRFLRLSPSEIVLPANGSVVAFVEVDTDAPNVPGTAIEIASDGETLARLEVSFEVAESDVEIVLGSAAVQESSNDVVSLPGCPPRHSAVSCASSRHLLQCSPPSQSRSLLDLRRLGSIGGCRVSHGRDD